MDLMITGSLNAALWQYCASGDVRFRWADALCITQEDELEKTAEVRRMKPMLEEPYAAILWIGEKHEDNISGLDLL